MELKCLELGSLELVVQRANQNYASDHKVETQT